MKRPLEIIFALIVLALAPSCGNKNCRATSKDDVSVLIINESGHYLSSLVLKHEKGIKNIGPLADSAQTCVSFHSPGESSYTLTATLENGDTLISSQYTEGGYALTETIMADSIQTKHQQADY
ncbi:MAG: hypothetical protein V4620_09835 [Bacteroidota bacterium]